MSLVPLCTKIIESFNTQKTQFCYFPLKTHFPPPSVPPVNQFGAKMVPLALFIFSLCFFNAGADISNKIGINYGQLGNNLPTPYQSIQHIVSLKAGRVKLYNSDPEVLQLLGGTNLHVSIMVGNNEISDIAANQTNADTWVRQRIAPFVPTTLIRFLCVGNEVLSLDRPVWSDLVPAMRRLKTALKSNNITNIKISSPVAMDVLTATFPPSNASFRPDIAEPVIVPMLRFLNRTKSFLFVDVYPYFAWSANPARFSLDYALFRGNHSFTDPGTGLNYTNLLDQMLDAVVLATEKLGFPDINLVISETGWPNGGDLIEPGANVRNAAVYNRNLVRRMTAKPAIGTPARPGVTIPTFLFALYNENRKPGPGTERHWGILRPTGEPVYEVDLTGKRRDGDYPALPEASNNGPFKGEVWCVAVDGANVTELTAQIGVACRSSNRTCEALLPGRECYQPVWVTWHASYAFSSYWAQFRGAGASCYFNGVAHQTTTDPSSGSCKFPSVRV